LGTEEKLDYMKNPCRKILSFRPNNLMGWSNSSDRKEGTKFLVNFCLMWHYYY